MRRARYYSSYYNNPYGNQYGNPYNNPYANPNATQGSAQNVDPFPEFGNGDATNSGSDNPFGTEGFGQDN
ncbi:MAG: hypothetical protein J6R88_06100, partial [Clostridia bacterium]|nr:hypothetical protein [Clostridia bacterium]